MSELLKDKGSLYRPFLRKKRKMYLDWLTQNRRPILIDIETDGLSPTVVWCLCWQDVTTKDKGVITDYEEMRTFLQQTDVVWVGHNILKFDVPHLNRLVGSRITVSQCIDTLVLSMLYSPSIGGGHSLGAWGQRLGKTKIEFSDWSRLSPEMITYCEMDVEINVELFIRLTSVLKRLGFTEKACEIQHKITSILKKQQDNGFYFDAPRAVELYQSLLSRQQELKELIYHAFPPQRITVGSYSKAFKADGQPTANFLRHKSVYPEVRMLASGGYEVFNDVEFNLGSPKQRVEKLLELGWKPEEFTPRRQSGGGGTPKPTQGGELSPSLARFADEAGIEEVAFIAKWMALNGRSNMINTWLENYNHRTSCIHGSLFVADTLRFRHQAPNTANIPAVRIGKDDSPVLGEAGYYTYEARDLWCARPGRLLVGTDAAGLELRMLAHYLRNPEFTEQVVNGDPHTYNQIKAGLPTRANAKTFIYAFLYGAGDAKIGKIVGGTAARGKELKEAFSQNVDGLAEVLNECDAEFRLGRISLVDGSRVVCPSPHAALNYKLQGGGARLMAQGAILLEAHIRRLGLDSLKVGDIHDEWQYDVHPSDADQHAKLAVQSLREAGEELNLNVPIDGTSKEGRTWAETH